MSKSYNFSQGPDDNPFEDPAGKNPFADDQPAGSAEENPYAAPRGQNEPAYRPFGYEAFAPHRGPVILVLGLLGLVGVGLGALCCGPAVLLSLALALPAWMMGRTDLRAIDSGAMDPSGRGMTLAGYVLGVVATVVVALVFVLFVVLWGGFLLFEFRDF